MKTKNLFLLPTLVAVLNLLPAGRVTAQIFGYGADGANPYGGLILSGQTLYGTARDGGSSGYGTVFAVGTNGAGFTILHSFTGAGDGASPYGGLITNSSGRTLYGTASGGGSSGFGTVFAVNTDGSGFTNLHSFTATDTNGINSDGANPYAGLILSGNTLYGTASSGGSSGQGTVFALNTDGTGFTNLHSFTASDGAFPHAGLILSGITLYGTAVYGGKSRSGGGTVFALNTDGTGFTNLHSFTGPICDLVPPYHCRPDDGHFPYAGLVVMNNTLYGTTQYGGQVNSGNYIGYGTVFAVNTDGTGFTNLHSFTSTYQGGPQAGLVLSGNTLYGTASGFGFGTVFAVNTDSTGFTSLLVGPDRGKPYAGLILSGNTLYGTAAYGGTWPWLYGTVFAVNTNGAGATNLHTFQPALLQVPQLTISLAGTNVLLMWPSVSQWFVSWPHSPLFYTYRLQSTTSLGPSAVWNIVSAAPVAVNGQKIVANPSSGTQQFYRLILQSAYVYYACDDDSDCPCGACVLATDGPYAGGGYCAYPDGFPCP